MHKAAILCRVHARRERTLKITWRSLSRETKGAAVYRVSVCKHEGEKSEACQKVSYFVQEFLWDF